MATLDIDPYVEMCTVPQVKQISGLDKSFNLKPIETRIQRRFFVENLFMVFTKIPTNNGPF